MNRVPWVSGDIKERPSAGTILVVTPSLSFGLYEVDWFIHSDAPATLAVQLVNWDGTVVRSQRFSVDMGRLERVTGMRVMAAEGQRLQIVNVRPIVGEIQCSIY